MKEGATTRQGRSKPQKAHCVFCGSTVDIEFHHIGGRNHVFWITAPLCRAHHVQLTDKIRLAGIDMRFTSDVRERFAQARMATFVFLWTLEEMLTEYEQRKEQP